MLTGFRAGADPALGLNPDDFTGTRRAWGLVDGSATLGRVFPDSAVLDTRTSPDQLVARLDRAALPVVTAGMIPFLSFKPDVTATLAADLDQHFAAAARWVEGLGRPVYLTVWHEPENDLLAAAKGDYRGRAKNFVAVFTRAYQVMKQIAAAQLCMGPVYMAYQWRAAGVATANSVALDWRVPDGSRDFTGVDSYTSNWSWAGGATLERKADFQRWMTALNVAPSEVLLVERGITGNAPAAGPDPAAAQAATLRADYDYLARLGAHGLMVWNSGGASDDSSYLLTEPARVVFADLAKAAAAVAAAGYDAGYAAGVADGRVDGIRTGRAQAFAEAAVWAQSQTGML